jgi:hypothetical protein
MRWSYLPGNDKIEQDYKEFDGAIEELAKADIEKIKKKANQLKAEAEKVGEAVEASLEEEETNVIKKKS